MSQQLNTLATTDENQTWTEKTLGQGEAEETVAKKFKITPEALSKIENENSILAKQARTTEVPITKVGRHYKGVVTHPRHMEAMIEKKRERNIEFYETVAHWQGIITEVLDDKFSAKVKLIGEQENANEENYIDFNIHEVSESQRHCIVAGANFSWYLCRRTEYLYKGIPKQGTIEEGKSIIKFEFRRLPAWTKKDLEEMEADAAELSKYLE